MIENQKNYEADSIVELKFPQTVREKVGMYLGDGGQNGFFHTLTEILDNSIDEFVAGHGSKIEIKIDSKKNLCSIRDYGRGIPFSLNKDGVSALVLAMTTLHAGGKHRSPDGTSSYKYSSGINGVGASVVNGVSDIFFVKSVRNNEVATIQWKNGLIDKELTIEENVNSEKNGTYVEWIPSIKKDEFDHFNVFESDCKFEKEDVINKLQYLPYLNIGLEINLIFDDEEITFKKEEKVANILKIGSQSLILDESPTYKEELALLLDKNSGNKKVLSMLEFIDLSDKEKLKYEVKTSLIELSFNFTSTLNPLQLNFANGVKISGGKPDTSFKISMKNIINDYLREQGKKVFFEQEDIFNNLTFMLSVKINQPSFAGQTKDKLNNPESSILTNHFMKKYLNYWINRIDKKELDQIIKILEIAQKARESTNKILSDSYKSINNMKESEILHKKGKLEDCYSSDPTKNELFIVEGESAGGGVRITRNPKYQAFIPLKGKPLNVIKKANQSKIFKNNEIMSLAYALGGIGEDFNIEKLRYHKIVILTDADLDGFHINALVLTFFYHFYIDLIKKGYVYIALAPLYKIEAGTKYYYAWDKEELKEITKDLKNYSVTRNKGLGEMNPRDLFDTTLNPLNRKFIQVNIEDFEDTKKNIEIFMDDNKEGKKALKNIIRNFYSNNKDNKKIIDLEMIKMLQSH